CTSACPSRSSGCWSGRSRAALRPSESTAAEEFSWESSQPKERKANAGGLCGLCGKLLFVGEVGHEVVTAWRAKADVIYVQNPHAEADLGANGIQIGIEGLFGDGEIRQPHGNDTALAPDEQCQCLLQRNDLQRAGVGHVVVGEQ